MNKASETCGYIISMHDGSHKRIGMWKAKKKKKRNNIWELPKLMENINQYIQQAQVKKPHRPTSIHMIAILLNYQWHRDYLETNKGIKWLNQYKGSSIKFLLISHQNPESKRWDGIFNVLKGKYSQPRLLYLTNYPPKWKRNWQSHISTNWENVLLAHWCIEDKKGNL